MATLFTPSLVPAGIYDSSLSSGAQWAFYLTGTLVPADVYTDATLVTPLTNPVVSDGAGNFVSIYMDDAVIYRAKLQNFDATDFKDIDPVNQPIAAVATAAAQSAASAAASADSAADSAAITASTAGSSVDTSLFVLKTGDTSTGTQAVTVVGGGTASFAASGEGTVSLSSTRRSTDVTGPTIVHSKGRGTIAAPLVIAQNDYLGETNYRGYDGAADRTGATLRVQCIAAVPSATDFETRLTCFLIPPGSGSQLPMFHFDQASGFSMYGGSNVVINQNLAFQPGPYAIAALPSATTSGQIIYCTDASPSGALLYSKGGSWIRMTNNGAVVNAVDAAFTVTYLTDAPIQRISNFTTVHNVNLQATNAAPGASFTIINLATSAGNATVRDAASATTLKALVPGSWCDVTYRLTAWELTRYGTL